MATHAERLAAAKASIAYICSRTDDEMVEPVPNCPGWTVYNAAVHIGRVGVAWHSMILASPDDPDSRTRGYADAEARGTGHSPEVLATWATAAIDAIQGDVDHPCYFSMTGGLGTAGLWAWHAASELAVHRLDVEAALGHDHAISDELAGDALAYTAEFFLPAMARVTETNPGALHVVANGDDDAATATVRATGDASRPAATASGQPVDLLLALWGRPHGPIDIRGQADIIERWAALPSVAFQFGTWD